jgi:hypothetical protein
VHLRIIEITKVNKSICDKLAKKLGFINIIDMKNQNKCIHLNAWERTIEATDIIGKEVLNEC